MAVVIMIRLLALGLAPAAGFAIWEASLRRRTRRFGVACPVSAEGVRWALYAAGAYELAYASLTVAWLDGAVRAAGALVPLVTATICTMLATGLLLWHLGERYAPRIPRLGDLRADVYGTRLAIVRRCRLLRWQASRRRPEMSTADREAAGGEMLLRRSDAQLRRLQQALTTQSFLRRVKSDPEARAQLDAIVGEQRRLLGDVQHFLARTEPVLALAQPYLATVRVW